MWPLIWFLIDDFDWLLRKLKKNLMAPFFMDGVQLPQGYNHFEEAVYFLPFSSQKFLVLILSTLEEWKLSRPWSHPVVLNTGPLDWEFSALTTRLLLHELNCWIVELKTLWICYSSPFKCIRMYYLSVIASPVIKYLQG